MATMPPVPMTLYQVAGSRARSGADQGAFLAPYQGASTRADGSANYRAFNRTVMMSSTIVAALPGQCCRRKAEKSHQDQKHNQHSLASNSSRHSLTSIVQESYKTSPERKFYREWAVS